MLGTYSPVGNLDWAVIVQKPRDEAYRGVFEMQRTARLLALLAILLSVGISIFAARRITNPLEVLTASSRAIARGDFSQRVKLKSRTEIGELAATFNTMSEELEQFVLDLKRAATENRELFMGSIQMLAGAVDEKDPYTRGHSDRVTRYSMLIAKEMGHPEEFLEIVRVSAQLHDVGKIGIEDRHPQKAGRTDAGRIRNHEDPYHQGGQHPAPGGPVERHDSGYRTAPRIARRARLSPGLKGCGDPVVAAHYRRGRHIRRTHHKPSLSAGARSGSRLAHHPQSFRQAARSRRGCRSDSNL